MLTGLRHGLSLAAQEAATNPGLQAEERRAAEAWAAQIKGLVEAAARSARTPYTDPRR
jgi:hypothetical protein